MLRRLTDHTARAGTLAAAALGGLLLLVAATGAMAAGATPGAPGPTLAPPPSSPPTTRAATTTTGSTTSTTRQPTPTTSPVPTMPSAPSTPSTTAPASPTSTVATTPGDPAGAPAGAGGQPASGGSGSGQAPAGGAYAGAEDALILQAEAGQVSRSGYNSTAALLGALTQLYRFGLTPVQAAVVGMGRFPVAGLAVYRDDWHEYRSFPQPHLHEGVDIVAASGTPLRSPVDGVLRYSDSDPDGYGLSAIVTQDDGTYFLMAHMSATVLGLASGARVRTGQVVGFVGATGDATGPHCHFEIHPHGGGSVDPKPYLDAFLSEALADVPLLVNAFAGTPASPPPPVVAPIPQAVPEQEPSAALALASPTAATHHRGWSGTGLARALAVVGVVCSAGAAWDALERRRYARRLATSR